MPTALAVHGASALALGLALLVRWLLDPLLGDSLPLVTLFGAVAAAVWFGGRWPAIAVAVAGYLACNLLFIAPRGRLAVGEPAIVVGAIATALTCAVIIAFGEALRRAGRRAGLQREALRTTLASLGEAVIASDAEGRVTTINPVAEALTGWHGGSAVGRPLDEVWRVDADDASTLIARDGSRHPVEGSAAPIRDADGRVLGTVRVFRDATERRATDERLHDSREQLRLAVAESAVPTMLFDADGAVRLVNRAWCDASGWPAAELAMLDDWTRRSGHRLAVPAPDAPQRLDLGTAVVRTPRGEARLWHVHVTPIGAQARDLRLFVANAIDLTERRRADASLRMALAAAHMVAWDYDVATDRVRASDNVAELYGLTSVVEQAAQGFALVHPDDRPHHQAIVQRAMERGEAYRSQFRVVRPVDGRVVWMEEHAQAFRDGHGATRLAGVVMDVSERKRDSLLLGGQKRVLEMVATGAALGDVLAALVRAVEENDPALVCGVLLVDTAGRCLRRGAGPSLPDAYLHAVDGAPLEAPYANPCAETAGSGAEIVSRDVQMESRWSGAWRRAALGSGLRACRTLPVRLPDGTVAAVLAVYRREPEREAPDARLMRMATHLLGVALERARAAHELASDLELMTRLQELSTRLVGAAEPRALLQEMLGAAVALTGHGAGEIRLRSADDGPLESAFRQGLSAGFASVGDGLAPWDRVLQGGRRVVVADVANDRQVLSPALREALLREGLRAVQATPLTSRAGQLLGLLATGWRVARPPDERTLRALDMLARMAADFIERQRTEQALHEAARHKDEFLATLAHELRNPLAPIRNAVELLRRGDIDAAQLRATTGMLDRQVRQLFRLMDDLLDMNRVARGDVLLRRTPVDLADVVMQAAEAAAPQLRAHGHELALALPEAPLIVHGDPARLAQVLGNLLSNASKFTERGATITLAVEREDPQALIRVRDPGIGIAAQEIGRIFEMFAQVDSSPERRAGGLGIGLSLAKRLVELHGGSLSAHSEGLGCGSEFTVRLPLMPQPALPRSAPPPSPPPPAVRMRRVLVVDDNRDGARSMAELLQLIGHEAEVAHDGLEALAAAERMRPDAVLMDIGLPRMNGHEVCRRIRAQPWGRRMLLVAVTGWGQEADRERSLAAGVDAHLVKPVDLDALLALMATLQPADA